MTINRPLLPVKGHYFLFNAGTSPLVPYLPTYARQQGFSSATVGLIYTVLPIFGLFAKPIFGVIADRFKVQKYLFIWFQVITIISFGLIYFIPNEDQHVTIELDCDQGNTSIRSCYNNVDDIDFLKLNELNNQTLYSACKMVCDVTSDNVRNTLCNNWGLKEYCTNIQDPLRLSSFQQDILNDCHLFPISTINLEDKVLSPQCVNNVFKSMNQDCNIDCTSENESVLSLSRINFTCINNQLFYSKCNVSAKLPSLLQNMQCENNCGLSDIEAKESFNRLLSKSIENDFSDEYISFEAKLLLSSFKAEQSCVFSQMTELEIDGNVFTPKCTSSEDYLDNKNHLTSCDISCDNEMVNELLLSANVSRNENGSQFTQQFWMFFLLMIISWIGQAVVVSIADAICFNILDKQPSLYGRQRLWGSVGFGIFSLLTGTLIDVMSVDDTVKNYSIAFVFMLIFLSGDVVVSFFIKTQASQESQNILADVGVLFSSIPILIFFLWTIVVGLCTGLLWQFLFWHLEDVSSTYNIGTEYIKTLQGLVSAIQTFGGEIPFMFVSGHLLEKLGHINVMTLVLLGFGVRFILYSFLTNPWLVLPIELLQGLTLGMFYPTSASYANVVSPAGTETTVQGLVGAIFEGVGTSLGSFIGGIMFETYGGWNTFRWFGCGSLIFSIIPLTMQVVQHRKNNHKRISYRNADNI